MKINSFKYDSKTSNKINVFVYQHLLLSIVQFSRNSLNCNSKNIETDPYEREVISINRFPKFKIFNSLLILFLAISIFNLHKSKIKLRI